MAKVSKLKALLRTVESYKKNPADLNDENLKKIENALGLINKVQLHPEEIKEHTYDPTAHKEFLNIPGQQDPTKKTDISFQFLGRLRSLVSSPEPLLSSSSSSSDQSFRTPPSSPRKKSPPSSPSKLKSPSKVPSRALGFDLELDKKTELLQERDLLEATSTKAYLEKILKLDEIIQSELNKLEKEIQAKRQAMKSYFQVLMLKNNLPYYQDHAEALLGELFDIVYRDNGTYEKLVVALSQGYAIKLANLREKQPGFSEQDAAKLILEVRNEVIINNPNLFKELGQVTERPENYFEVTPDSKLLAHDYLESLYAQPEQVAIMSGFQYEKEKAIKLGMIDKILSMRTHLYYQEVLFLERADGRRHYVTDSEDLETFHDFQGLELVPWAEIEGVIRANLELRPPLSKEPVNSNAILRELKKTYDSIEHYYNLITTTSEQNTCISFFPIKVRYAHSSDVRYICLVTTSGDINKLRESDEANKKALLNFQNSLKTFSSQYTGRGVDGVQYDFIYYDTEHGSIDILLQQLSKGFSGKPSPLSSIHPESEGILSDPFRACAEKKFIAFVRESLNNPDIKTFKILGAANLRMPIIPTPTHQHMFTQDVRDLYFKIQSFLDAHRGSERFLESGTFRKDLESSFQSKEIKKLKVEGKVFFDKVKAFHSSCINIVERFYKSEIHISTLEAIQAGFLLSLTIPDSLTSDNPTYELNEICREQMILLLEKMTEFFKIQKEFIAFMQDFESEMTSQLDKFSALSFNIGKAYKQVRDSLIFHISRIKSTGGLQKCHDLCSFELSHSVHEKQAFIQIVNRHRHLVFTLYDNWLMCLNKRLEAGDLLEIRAEALEMFNQFYEGHKSKILENIARLPESMAIELRSSFTAIEKRFAHSLSVIDKAGLPKFSTAALKESYTSDFERSKIECEIPVTFSIVANSPAAEACELETNFIDCCVACKANKLPVLTWLTDLQHKKQAKERFSETEGFLLPRTPDLDINPSLSIGQNARTTLTPGFTSFSLSEGSIGRKPASVESGSSEKPISKKLNFE
jgi:hypothetical protein